MGSDPTIFPEYIYINLNNQCQLAISYKIKLVNNIDLIQALALAYIENICDKIYQYNIYVDQIYITGLNNNKIVIYENIIYFNKLMLGRQAYIGLIYWVFLYRFSVNNLLGLLISSQALPTYWVIISIFYIKIKPIS